LCGEKTEITPFSVDKMEIVQKGAWTTECYARASPSTQHADADRKRMFPFPMRQEEVVIAHCCWLELVPPSDANVTCARQGFAATIANTPRQRTSEMRPLQLQSVFLFSFTVFSWSFPGIARSLQIFFEPKNPPLFTPVRLRQIVRRASPVY
jgi:hypothetical protein